MVSRFVAYPAADPNTLSVSATDVPASGDPTDVRSASFANVGPSPGTVNFSEGETSGVEVDIAAPGMAQEAQLDSGTTTLSGTSMAAPDVAGAAALPRDGGRRRPSRAPSRDRSTGPEPRAGGVETRPPRYSGSASERPARGRAGGRADGRRRTPRRHLPWGSGRTRQLARDLPVGISMTRTRRQFLASGGAAGLSFLPGWLPFVGVTQTTRSPPMTALRRWPSARINTG